MPSNQLELALWLETDRMGYLLDKLDQARLTNQQDVVRNERRQSVENQPYGMVEEAVYHAAVPEGPSVLRRRDRLACRHPGRAAGRRARLLPASTTRPNNASLAIAGDIDRPRRGRWVEKYFGSIPSGPPVPKITAVAPPITAEKRPR